MMMPMSCHLDESPLELVNEDFSGCGYVCVVGAGVGVTGDGVGVVTGVAVVVCGVVTGEVTATAVQFTAPTPSVKVPSGQLRHTSASAS